MLNNRKKRKLVKDKSTRKQKLTCANKKRKQIQIKLGGIDKVKGEQVTSKCKLTNGGAKDKIHKR